MSEKERFYNMTKPVRFRKFKLVKRYIVLWCKALVEQIHYSFNYILYKLHYLDKYSYRDNTERFSSCPYLAKTITTDLFSAEVSMKLKEAKDIFIEYFYRKTKSGNKITYIISDKNDTRVYMVCTLTNIKINIGGRWYDTHNIPHLKVSVLPLKPNMRDEDLEQVEYETKTLNIKYLQDLIHCNQISNTALDDFNLSYNALEYYYSFSCEQLKKHLEELTLKDLMM